MRSDKQEQKHRVPDLYYINDNYTNLVKSYGDHIEFRTGRKHKKRRQTKSSFPKEQVENADLYKPILNKIMTKEE